MATAAKKKPAEVGPQCSNCLHWKEEIQEGDHGPRWGFCHRYPPTATLVTIEEEPVMQALWPTTDHDERCGEWRGNQ